MFFETPWLRDKGGLQMRRGGLWVCSSAWCGKGHRPNEEIVQNAVRVGGEIKERVWWKGQHNRLFPSILI